MTMHEKNLDIEVILASLKLSRAMRRCPPAQGEAPFPPAVGRLLTCAAENPGVSSRELCEILDLRPSSLSEILSRAESEGLLKRAVDENDRRIQRVTLAEKGEKLVEEMEAARIEDARKKTACLTDEEKMQYIAICNKLSEHIERLCLDLPEGMRGPRHGCPPHNRGPHHGPHHGPKDAEWPGGDGEPGRPEHPEEKGGPKGPKGPDGRPVLPPGGRFRS